MSVGCAEHREGLRLLAMKLRLTEDNLDEDERQKLMDETAKLEAELDMD